MKENSVEIVNKTQDEYISCDNMTSAFTNPMLFNKCIQLYSNNRLSSYQIKTFIIFLHHLKILTS